MRSFRRVGLVMGLGMLALTASAAGAQSDAPQEGWQVTLDDQQYLWNVGLVGLAGDTLIVRQADTLVRTPIARVHELRVFRKTPLDVADERASAIRAMTDSGDEVYDVSSLDLAKRRELIQKLLSRPPADESP